METIILGIVVSLILELYKWLNGKYGQETSKHVLQAGLLVVSILIVVVLKVTPEHTANAVVEVMGSAFIFYEMLWKNFQKAISK